MTAWTPADSFAGLQDLLARAQQARVLLARYPCPYPREEHDPSLPPEDVDFSGRPRPRKRWRAGRD